MDDTLRRHAARHGRTSAWCIEIDDFQKHAIDTVEPAQPDGSRPTLEAAMLDWFINEEAQLGIPPCTTEENLSDLKSLVTKFDEYSAKRISIQFSDHLNRRLHDITVRKSNALTTELRNCFTYAAAELMVRQDPPPTGLDLLEN